MAVHSWLQILLPLLMTLHRLPSIHGVNQNLLSVACSDYALEREGRYICTEDGITCLAGWTDINSWCQEPVCGPECKKPNGICHAPDQCLCSIGYYGDECEYCTPLPGCMNGNCSKPFECNCREGWTGQLCDQPVCGKDCHHGYCTRPNGTCHCYNGWTGPNCDECLPLPGCDVEHGYCTEPMDCKCRPTWTGTFCHIPSCPEKCETHGNGHCEDGRCQCKIGWHGEDCTSCAPYPGCEHGSCSNPWECNCNQGWTGHLCNISKDYTTKNSLNPTATPNHATTHRLKRTENNFILNTTEDKYLPWHSRQVQITKSPNYETTHRIRNPLEELATRTNAPKINLATPIVENINSSRFNASESHDTTAEMFNESQDNFEEEASGWGEQLQTRLNDSSRFNASESQDIKMFKIPAEMINEKQDNFEEEASGMKILKRKPSMAEQLQATTTTTPKMSNVERRRNKNHQITGSTPFWRNKKSKR